MGSDIGSDVTGKRAFLENYISKSYSIVVSNDSYNVQESRGEISQDFWFSVAMQKRKEKKKKNQNEIYYDISLKNL